MWAFPASSLLKADHLFSPPRLPSQTRCSSGRTPSGTPSSNSTHMPFTVSTLAAPLCILLIFPFRLFIFLAPSSGSPKHNFFYLSLPAPFHRPRPSKRDCHHRDARYVRCCFSSPLATPFHASTFYSSLPFSPSLFPSLQAKWTCLP